MIFIATSVACAIGPSVNTFLVFHILIELKKKLQCEHIEGSTDFSFQTNFCNLFEFPATKFTKNNIFNT
jgi:peroxiredoxin family protein